MLRRCERGDDGLQKEDVLAHQRTLTQPQKTGALTLGERLARYRSARMLQRYATILCASIFLALVGSYASVVQGGDVNVKQADLIAPYSSGKLVLQGHGSEIYNFKVLGAAETKVTY